MPVGEFQLIQRFFTRQSIARDDVPLAGGDDCALLRVPAGMELAVTMDTLVEGRHFPVGTDPRAIGHKALAVNLSDLAAMGAEPAWATLSFSSPAADEAWLAAFTEGLFALAARHGVQLVGGDTVRGPLVLTLQLHGFVPAGQALRRDGARPGDRIFVTGTLGDAGAGLAVRQEKLQAGEAEAHLCRRLEYPEPRIAEGLALRGLASSAIDVSDGLAADLGHILERSGVGARIESGRLPLSAELVAAMSREAAVRLALTAGDDYELCFTVPAVRCAELSTLPFPVTEIGVIEETTGLRVQGLDGKDHELGQSGFDHFMGEG